jgi:deazaflavin-dependent oxidoreductase (nitroreductase family)
MGSAELKSALQNANEVELTVTGRKSGQESTRPIWFVEEGDKVLLLPVGGKDANWFKNVQKTPTIGLAAGGADARVDAQPTDDPSTVSHVIEVFGDKYGADRVKEYYPGADAAVEVPLA